MKYKGKWGLYELYIICNDYLDNQTEENSLLFVERIDNYKKKYIKEE